YFLFHSISCSTLLIVSLLVEGIAPAFLFSCLLQILSSCIDSGVFRIKILSANAKLGSNQLKYTLSIIQEGCTTISFSFLFLTIIGAFTPYSSTLLSQNILSKS